MLGPVTSSCVSVSSSGNGGGDVRLHHHSKDEIVCLELFFSSGPFEQRKEGELEIEKIERDCFPGPETLG